MTKRAFVFPGQGAQAVGMGQELAQAYPAAAAVFEEVDDALGEKLSDVMWNGPAEQLTLTQNAQPALMAASLAAVKALEAELGADPLAHASYVAGHSLGEYSALAAAGSVSVADAARLLRARGAAMQQAAPVGAGAMAAILGLELAEAEAVAADAAQGEVCQAANDNAPGQVVVSGAKAAVERAAELAKERGAKRALLLDVSAPFHCEMMAPAADVMLDALSKVAFQAPKAPLVANVIAEETSDPSQIKELLVEQVTGRVRWRESVMWMAAQGVEELVELGSGKVLSGLARRIERSLKAAAVGGPDDVKTFAAALKA